MGVSLQEIEADTLGLPASDHARLARRLIQSLNEEIDGPAEVERAWETEIQRRLEE